MEKRKKELGQEVAELVAELDKLKKKKKKEREAFAAESQRYIDNVVLAFFSGPYIQIDHQGKRILKSSVNLKRILKSAESDLKPMTLKPGVLKKRLTTWDFIL